jgi:hypothetical protein
MKYRNRIQERLSGFAKKKKKKFFFNSDRQTLDFFDMWE